jgi:hypothetical protein
VQNAECRGQNAEWGVEAPLCRHPVVAGRHSLHLETDPSPQLAGHDCSAGSRGADGLVRWFAGGPPAVPAKTRHSRAAVRPPLPLHKC